MAAGAAYPAFIQSFRVNPEESKKEAPYIKRNIAATRAAMNINLSNKNVKDFAYDDKNLNAQALVDNSETIRNVRLWDPKVLQLSYQRLQGLRTFYEFNDADIDRYNLDDRKTQVLIAARELNTAGVTSSSWVNRHLQYTHGYGAVLSPANATTPEGDPQLIVKDLPPTGDIPIDQPGLYYGENLEGYAIVKTQQREDRLPPGERHQPDEHLPGHRRRRDELVVQARRPRPAFRRLQRLHLRLHHRQVPCALRARHTAHAYARWHRSFVTTTTRIRC